MISKCFSTTEIYANNTLICYYQNAVNGFELNNVICFYDKCRKWFCAKGINANMTCFCSTKFYANKKLCYYKVCN